MWSGVHRPSAALCDVHVMSAATSGMQVSLTEVQNIQMQSRQLTWFMLLVLAPLGWQLLSCSSLLLWKPTAVCCVFAVMEGVQGA